MADDGIASGSPGNNPRKATKQEIVELYRKAYFDSPGSYE
jgi:alcohol dehydrogenase class IV